jgi:hypothetical protein
MLHICQKNWAIFTEMANNSGEKAIFVGMQGYSLDVTVIFSREPWVKIVE